MRIGGQALSATQTERDVNEWRFASAEREDAAAFLHEQGFVGFTDLVTPAELATLRGAYDELVADGRLDVSEGLIVRNDALFLHPEFERFVRRPDVVDFVESLFARPVEIQHSKLNCKPPTDGGEGRIAWHQDYPFFPHTNYDLVAVGVHLDDEGPAEGPSALFQEATAAARCPRRRRRHVRLRSDRPATRRRRARRADDRPGGSVDRLPLPDPPHLPEPKRSTSMQRILITPGIRARDAIQLAGVIWEAPAWPWRVRQPTHRALHRRLGGRAARARRPALRPLRAARSRSLISIPVGALTPLTRARVEASGVGEPRVVGVADAAGAAVDGALNALASVMATACHHSGWVSTCQRGSAPPSTSARRRKRQVPVGVRDVGVALAHRSAVGVDHSRQLVVPQVLHPGCVGVVEGDGPDRHQQRPRAARARAPSARAGRRRAVVANIEVQPDPMTQAREPQRRSSVISRSSRL